MVRESFPDKATFKRRLEDNYNLMALHMAGVGRNRNSLPRTKSHPNLCQSDSKIIGGLCQLILLLALPLLIAIFGIF